jgi:hypothetical protein
MSEYINLSDLTKRGTQLGLIAEIFEDNVGKPITKRYIEKEYTFKYMHKNVTYPIVSEEEHRNQLLEAPGDVQRQLRTFHDKFKKYGLKQEGKTGKKEDNNVIYTWTPKLKTDMETKIQPAARNIFKTKKMVNDFMKSKKNKCELCDDSNKDERLAVDHWRAHSIYNVDDEKIAVLLCETCNNIHHNYDASKCMINNKDNIKYIQNWVKIEKRVRDCGFMPNEHDKNTQNNNIQFIKDYYTNELNVPLQENFWENL